MINENGFFNCIEREVCEASDILNLEIDATNNEEFCFRGEIPCEAPC